MNTIHQQHKRSEIMGTIFIVGAALKLAAMGGLGLGACASLKYFHEFDFKTKKKGDKNEQSYSESLREKAKGLS